MIDCEHRSRAKGEAVCRIASDLAGIETRCQEDACRACISANRPRQANYVTASLAIRSASEGGVLEKSRKAALTRYLRKNGVQPQIEQTGPPGTAGTELKRVLEWFSLAADTSCQCASRAAAMDQRGNIWCERNIDAIVGWLMESWDKNEMSLADFLPSRYRKRLTFLSRLLPERQIAAQGARFAVRTAIKRARRTDEKERKEREATAAQNVAQEKENRRKSRKTGKRKRQR